jgi:polyamine oxidase
LEARTRIGGRVHQHCLSRNLLSISSSSSSSSSLLSYDDLNPQVVIQLGANWIHNCNENVNPMFSLARKLDLNVHKTSPDEEPGDDICLFDAGQLNDNSTFHRMNKEEYKSIVSRWEWIRDNMETYYHVSELDNSNDSLLEAFKIMVHASENPTLGFGPCSPICWRGLNWCFDRLSIDSAMPIQNVSTKAYCSIECTGMYGEGLVQGGYFQLLKHLAAEYPLDIRFNHIVSKVQSNDDDTVTIICTNGETFITDACLVTLPVGVLQSGTVEFNPKPPQLYDFLEQHTLKPGLMNLVWLWYPEIFWDQNDINFFGIARDMNEKPTFTTFLAPPMFDQYGQRQPILMCQVYGDFAIELENMNNKDISDIATEVLRKMFGKDIVPDAIGCVHSSWLSDPYSRGSWATTPSKPEMRHTSSPSSSCDIFNHEYIKHSCEHICPGIYVAGEATIEFFTGTVHAAYISGMREAEKIMSDHYLRGSKRVDLIRGL